MPHSEVWLFKVQIRIVVLFASSTSSEKSSGDKWRRYFSTHICAAWGLMRIITQSHLPLWKVCMMEKCNCRLILCHRAWKYINRILKSWITAFYPSSHKPRYFDFGNDFSFQWHFWNIWQAYEIFPKRSILKPTEHFPYLVHALICTVEERILWNQANNYSFLDLYT